MLSALGNAASSLDNADEAAQTPGAVQGEVQPL